MADNQQVFPQGLTGDSLPSPWGASASWLTMSDGAAVWFSDCGQGTPIVLVHGWMGSSVFWQRNVPELAKSCRVVTLDLRGHGNSAKVLHGLTLTRLAEDIRELIRRLDLADPLLVGWSMGGSILMEYWRRFAEDSPVRALAFVDSNLAPFADAPWNASRMKAGRSDAANEAFQNLAADPDTYVRNFVRSLFFEGRVSDQDLAWAVAECRKTPPWIATAVYSDFIVRNYEPLLSDVTVPTAVFSGEFGQGSREMGRHFASVLPEARFFDYPDAGHMLFYEQAGRFNRELAAFAASAPCAAVPAGMHCDLDGQVKRG